MSSCFCNGMQIIVYAYSCVTSDVAVHVQQPYRGRSRGAAVLPAAAFDAVRRRQVRGRGVTGSRDLHGEGQGQGQGRSRQQQQQSTASVDLVEQVLKTNLMNIHDRDDVTVTSCMLTRCYDCLKLAIH